MNYSARVCFCQSIGNLGHKLEKFAERCFALINPGTQRNSLDELHYNEVQIVNAIDFINVSDVWMAECGDGISFLAKAIQSFWIGNKLSRKYFDCLLYTSPSPRDS